MGLTLVVLTAEQKANEAAETGINLESFSVRYFPQFKDYLPNFQGQFKGYVVPDKLSREVNVQGEVSGSTGLMAVVWNAAVTFANDVADFVGVTSGTNAGTFTTEEITISQSRDGWRTFNGSFRADPLVIIA